MERFGIFSMVLLLIWMRLTVCLSAPVANATPSKEIADPIITGPGQDANVKDEEVEALHSLATTADNKTSGVPVSLNKTALDARNHVDDNKAAVSAMETKRSSPNIFYELSTSKDTPRDMAEYIFWTGDESGVTKTISDFVDQGLMTPDEGLSFLDEVKYFLEVLQLKYGTLSAASSLEEARQSEPVTNAPHVHKAADVHPSEKTHKNAIREHGSAAAGAVSSTDPIGADSVSAELKDRLELAEVLSNEYSLEEIIYQLSRILFAQSLSQEGNADAEEALQRFADFLEKDAKEGRLSPQLQKKVLEVLLMALFDALGEHPHSAESSASSKHFNLEFIRKPSILKNP